MSNPISEPGQAGHFIPLTTLPTWTQAMHQACGAERQGQVQRAIDLYQAALDLAQERLRSPAAGNEEACLAALVSSRRCLSALHEEQDDSARAAVWYSHDTHEALVSHWQTHGPDAVIEDALRAGCLAVSAQPSPIH